MQYVRRNDHRAEKRDKLIEEQHFRVVKSNEEVAIKLSCSAATAFFFKSRVMKSVREPAKMLPISNNSVYQEKK